MRNGSTDHQITCAGIHGRTRRHDAFLITGITIVQAYAGRHQIERRAAICTQGARLARGAHHAVKTGALCQFCQAQHCGIDAACDAHLSQIGIRQTGQHGNRDQLARGTAHRIARRAFCYVAQEKALFPEMTVGENLRLGVTDDRLFRARLPGIEPYFPILLQRLNQKAGSLSGGEQKMLLVSRAILARPRLMLLDEISEGLQPSVIDRLARVLAAQRREHGTAILLVEQNVVFALSVADGFAVLTSGMVVERGAASDHAAAARIEQHMRI